MGSTVKPCRFSWKSKSERESVEKEREREREREKGDRESTEGEKRSHEKI